MLDKPHQCRYISNDEKEILEVIFRAPDYSKAVQAAEKILELLNRKPTIDNGSSDGEEIVSKYD